MTLAEAVAGIAVIALAAYAVLGGADFGGGVWDLLSRGPRAAAHRKLIERAIAPVWEANHVWLILVIVILFTAFPAAFSAISTALHVPLTLMLLGIVFRGTAFTFRHYDTAGDPVQLRWGRVFAVASTITPVLLGVILGALSEGRIRLDGWIPVTGFFEPWLHPFPLLVGLFALALFAFLAAVFLTVESPDGELEEDFRRRALVAGVVAGALALGTAVAGGPELRERLLDRWWSWPLQLGTGIAAVLALAALAGRRFRVARAAAIAQVALIVIGWGLLQAPFLVYPDMTIETAQAPRITLLLLLIALGAGMPVLLPSLYWLLRVFKRTPAFEPLDRDAP